MEAKDIREKSMAKDNEEFKYMRHKRNSSNGIGLLLEGDGKNCE